MALWTMGVGFGVWGLWCSATCILFPGGGFAGARGRWVQRHVRAGRSMMVAAAHRLSVGFVLDVWQPRVATGVVFS